MNRTPYPINLRVFLGCIGVSLFLILTGSSGCTSPASTSKNLDKTAKTKIQEAYGKLPLYFIRNDGQVDGKVKFYEKGSGHATFFTKEGVYLALTSGQKKDVVDSKSTQPQASLPGRKIKNDKAFPSRRQQRP